MTSKVTSQFFFLFFEVNRGLFCKAEQSREKGAPFDTQGWEQEASKSVKLKKEIRVSY
jgi:hypothetical protein